MSKSFIPILVFIFILVFQPGKAQDKDIYEGLSIKINTGLSTFHGDITKSPYGSLSDAKLGFGITGIKKFNPIFGIQFRYFTSQLSTIRTDLDEQFTGEISEIGLAFRIEPFKSEGPNGPRKVYPYARIGISSASFRAKHWIPTTNNVIPPTFGYKLDNISKGSKENALSFPIAIGFGYKISKKLSLEFEHNTSFTNSDIFDAMESGQFKDIIGFTSIGFRYYFGAEPLAKSKSTKNRSSRLLQTPIKQATEEPEEEIIDPYDKNYPVTKVFVESIFPEDAMSGKFFEVRLKVHKNNYKGPASIVQKLPSGFTALETPLRHARLAFKNQQVRIDWKQMPVDSIIDIKYHIHVADQNTGLHSVQGYIIYSQPEGSQVFNFDNHTYIINSLESKMDEKFRELMDDGKKESQKISRSVIIDNPEQKQKEEDLDRKILQLLGQFENTGRSSGSSFPTTFNPGVEFRIQIGAFSTQDEHLAIIRRYNITDPFKEEFHKRYYKYTVGSLKTFKDAERWRDAFIQRTTLQDVFIVAYRDGVRLNHVNEARR